MSWTPGQMPASRRASCPICNLPSVGVSRDWLGGVLASTARRLASATTSLVPAMTERPWRGAAQRGVAMPALLQPFRDLIRVSTNIPCPAPALPLPCAVRPILLRSHTSSPVCLINVVWRRDLDGWLGACSCGLRAPLSNVCLAVTGELVTSIESVVGPHTAHNETKVHYY